MTNHTPTGESTPTIDSLMDKVVQRLTEARERIASPSNWTRASLAKDCHDRPTAPRAPSAVCWCAIGSLHASRTLTADADEDLAIHTYARSYLEDAAEKLAQLPAVLLNDTRGHTQVMYAYATAIAAAKEAARVLS